jgi:UDP-4-amino-4,6-dideoxy-N-acetyl-beta-L-altrosamine N-acetyltransferase
MLQGRRIRLRAIDEADLPLIVQWRNEPEVYEYFYEYEPLSIRQEKAWYEKQLGNGSERNFIISLHDGKAVGMVSLVRIDTRNRRAEYGRLLVGDKESKGAGFGVDAEVLVLQYAFDHLNLNRLYCEVLTSNTSVVEMHKSLGFREEGIMRQFVYKAGAYQDVLLLAMLRSDYDREMAEGQLGKLSKSLI